MKTPQKPSINIDHLLYSSNAPPTFKTSLTRVHRYRPSAQSRSASNTSISCRPKTALFFPGQGVQRVGMASLWLKSFPRTCKPFLEELDDLLNYPLSRIIAEGPNKTLTATENAQPAIMAISIMVLRVLEKEFNFKTVERVDVCLGHSLGEFSALVSSKHLRYEDALRLLRRRAEVMTRLSRAASKDSHGVDYGMVALLCEPDRLSSLIETVHEFLRHDAEGTRDDSSSKRPIEQVSIGNINSKNQIVLSGNIERINTLLVQLRQFGGHDPRAVRLSTDSPFHSPLMADAGRTMREMLANTKVNFPGVFPCVSNVSARPFSSEADLKDLLARECMETVRWWDSIKYLHQEWDIKRWIGLGPGKVGRNLVGKEVGMEARAAGKGGGVWGISDPKEVEECLTELERTDLVDEAPET